MDHLSLKYMENENEYLNGPDQVLPSNTYFTSERYGAVKIRGSQGQRNGNIHPTPRPISLPTLLMTTVKKYPESTALAMKRDGEWIQWTYDQFQADVRSCAKAFIHLGLDRLHTVAILGYNTPEWFIAENAAIFAGGVAMGIYTTNTPELCRYNLEDSKANIVIVEDDSFLQKILPYRHELKHLKAIIQYTGEVKHKGVMTWKQLVNLGENLPDHDLDQRLRRIAINQVCILVYTSGTTGNPKGVMLSHDNMVISAINISERCAKSCIEEGNRYVSFLPLSHVAAQAVDMFTQIYIGSAVYFADKDAFKGTLVQTMHEAHPTVFLSVPRVYEKIYEKVLDQVKQMSTLKRTLFKWARSVGYDYVTSMERGDNTIPFGFSLASAILKKVREAVGLDHCYFCSSGAASVPIDVLQYLASLNIPIMETFGMSECCGPHTLACPSGFRLGSAGRTFPGGKIRVSGKFEGEGELCLWGRNVFMGYLEKPEFIESATSKDGWLKTGDIAKVDKDGFVYITGRIKELLVTAGGENIPPIPIEENIRAELPCVSQAVLVGDGKKFISVLLTLKTEVDSTTNEPTDQLQPQVKKWCERMGSTSSTVSDIILNQDSKVYEAIESGIARANSKATSNPQRIRKWILLPRDLSIHGGELGPTLKVKRDTVVQKYSEEVKALYSVSD